MCHAARVIMYEPGVQSLDNNKRSPFFLNSSAVCSFRPPISGADVAHHDNISPYKHQGQQSPALVSHASPYSYMQEQQRYALPVGANTPYDSPLYRGMPYQVSAV